MISRPVDDHGSVWVGLYWAGVITLIIAEGVACIILAFCL